MRVGSSYSRNVKMSDSYKFLSEESLELFMAYEKDGGRDVKNNFGRETFRARFLPW